ncbi:hypothetical protein IJ102_01010 [Candidatus Saccharibacteria bacterium]|nr:hypothetical protein [Candidatus Saccharibacteria bacterium]
MKTKISKIILKRGSLPAEVINLKSEDGQLMTNKLLTLLAKYGNDLLIPSELLADITKQYRRKSRRLRVAEAEIRRLQDVEAELQQARSTIEKLRTQKSQILEELEDLQDELIRAECAYTQLDDEFARVQDELNNESANSAWMY